MSYINRDDIKIKIKLLNSTDLLASATVIFLGVCETNGWRISKSSIRHPRFQEDIWIQPPCCKTARGWKKIVYINHKKTWEQVEEMIFDAYSMVRSQQDNIEASENSKDTGTKPENEGKEDVDPNEIPF